MMVQTRKHKNGGLDTYSCVGCGKTWKQNAKSIGHSQLACNRYHKKVYGWV